MKTNHYGVSVDSEIPVTGVFQNNSAEWLHEDSFNGVDLAWEEHIAECSNEEHDDCFHQDGQSEFLIGYRKNEEGLYEPDPEAEYSAIVGEIYTQVLRSDWIIRCSLCSPCYPGQGDADTPGYFLAYALPPDVMGNVNPKLKERIYEGRTKCQPGQIWDGK